MSISASTSQSPPSTSAIDEIVGSRRSVMQQVLDWDRHKDYEHEYVLRRVGHPCRSPVFSVLRRKLADPTTASGGQIIDFKLLFSLSPTEMAAQVLNGRPYLIKILKDKGITISTITKDNEPWFDAPLEVLRFADTTLILLPSPPNEGASDSDFELLLRFKDDPDHEIPYPVQKYLIADAVKNGTSIIGNSLSAHSMALQSIANCNPQILAIIEHEALASVALNAGCATEMPP